jgi:hypothetical protein
MDEKQSKTQASGQRSSLTIVLNGFFVATSFRFRPAPFSVSKNPTPSRIKRKLVDTGRPDFTFHARQPARRLIAYGAMLC